MYVVTHDMRSERKWQTSRETLIAAKDILRAKSHAELDRFFTDCGKHIYLGLKGGPSLLSRLDGAIRFIDENPNAKVNDATFEDYIIEEALSYFPTPPEYSWETQRELTPAMEKLQSLLETDGFAVNFVNGKTVLLAKDGRSVTIDAIIAKTALLDFDTVQRDVERAMQSISNDPEDAVTAACSLIESVCRSILIELNLPLPPKRDIDGLVKAIQEPLELSPGQTQFPVEIANDIRQMLSGLTSVAKGIGSLRTHGGDAHGREKGFHHIDARIPRLAVHTASTLSLFLIETWEQKNHRALPLRGVNYAK